MQLAPGRTSTCTRLAGKQGSRIGSERAGKTALRLNHKVCPYRKDHSSIDPVTHVEQRPDSFLWNESLVPITWGVDKSMVNDLPRWEEVDGIKGSWRFINSSFNSFLQFYNSREYYEIVKFKHPNNGDNINRALIMVKDKLSNRVEEFLSEAQKMDEAILEAKNKFLSETLLPYPPKLEAKIDKKITDSFSEGDIEVERDKIALTLSYLDENGIESFINNLENLKDIEEVPQNNFGLNSENPSSGYKWDSENWTFEGFSAKKKRPSNLANSFINVYECGFEDDGDLYFKTFWKPHYFPGVPIDYYSPKFVYAGDMLPKKDKPIKQNEPDCRELIKACLARKRSKVCNQVEQWIEDNNFILYDEKPISTAIMPGYEFKFSTKMCFL
ncbi:unnamed protein product [Brachionus calyciflorus]|uniref:Uncharacterized protein n=1 Tax=Brachionus calyciflorus TaxID=104777 RepID=A0A813SWW7_9BILA|nr:unnamed protein product [Brachionus calyciflorus]